MKKIININMSGRVIPIEDSAYEKLQGYIESLRRYFSREEDRDEIINDIESRIAELMSEKIRKGATCIVDADIDEMAASMGRPEDFEAEDAETKTTASSGYYEGTQPQTAFAEKKRRRLYRDMNDKFIGGVCSGIAAYLNVDPSIVRILFAIITFGGFGLGFLAYILLWVVLPEKENQNFVGKRLYRNPQDRILGGVAGGLAAYFNRETWVIRLIFVAPFIFSAFLAIFRGPFWHYDFDFVPNIVFGSLSSSFVLAYIILWIVLPEARSTYEKMEMRGEKVDVNTIAQNMKDRVKDWGTEVKESSEKFAERAKEFAGTKGKKFASEVGEVGRRAGSGIGHAIGVLFKVFFLFIAGSIAFGLFVGLMALLLGGIAWWPINNFLWTSKWQQLCAWGTLIFFLVVPLVGFITWVIRRVVRVRSRTSYLGWTFGALWMLGWVCAISLVVSIVRDFSYKSADSRAVPVTQPANGRMTVVVSDHALEYTSRFEWMNDDMEGWDLSPDSLKLSWVNFDVQKSPDSLYHVAVRGFGHGRNPEEALRRAEAIQYVIKPADSILDVSSGFSIYKDQKWRGQHIEIMIQVPLGKKIRFDETVRRKLNPSEISHRRRRRDNGVDMVYYDHGHFWWRSNTDYIMQADGRLLDTSQNRTIDGGYHFESEWNAPPPGPEPPTPVDTPKTSASVESMEDVTEASFSNSALPAFSLVRTFF
jgi:phage shock protein PspC (stress-responsive transcriptional regulator)